jgi:hypothetical protein
MDLDCCARDLLRQVSQPRKHSFKHAVLLGNEVWLRLYLPLFWSSHSLRYLVSRLFPDFAALYFGYGTDLPDGLASHSPVQPLSQKYSCSLQTQITSISAAIPSRTEGRIAIVTDVGHGMQWTRQRRRANGIAGRVLIEPVSEKPARRRTVLVADGEVVWS